MTHIFVPPTSPLNHDGTLVWPLFNSETHKDRLPAGFTASLSLAWGELPPQTHSQIHVMPFVDQVTVVAAGGITMRMMKPGSAEPCDLTLAAGQAALTPAGTFLQYLNPFQEVARLLYIVSPPYLAVAGSYDDSLLCGEDWEALQDPAWQDQHAERVRAARQQRDRL